MRRRWRHVDLRVLAVVAVAVLAAATLVVLSLRTPEPPPVAERDRTQERVGPDREGARSPERLALLGDFWAAGPGLRAPRQSSAAELACARSPQSYAHLVARRLGLELLDASCVGAGPEEVGRGGSTAAGLRLPSQLEVLSTEVDVVLVAVGAEAGDLLDRTVTACLQVALSAPRAAPCRQAFGEPGLRQVEQDAAASAQQVGVLLREIGKRAPQARVLVVGYANPFPTGSACFGRSGIADGDIDYLRQAMATIVGATRSATAAVDAEYVDPQPAFAGHLLCARSAYVATGSEVAGATVRLTRRGHRALADLLVREIGNAESSR